MDQREKTYLLQEANYQIAMANDETLRDICYLIPEMVEFPSLLGIFTSIVNAKKSSWTTSEEGRLHGF